MHNNPVFEISNAYPGIIENYGWLSGLAIFAPTAVIGIFLFTAVVSNFLLTAVVGIFLLTNAPSHPA